ncbi:PREDICTED: uncharacterized protein LOC109222831, partial [Nicotiana attenuata]|uniref:uncharacterized protein LOC109222831 n=1 Tax=Nicotiana attenuata TaxID=49451 RepID=UPI000905A458
MNEVSDDEEHYELLVSAVNGPPDKEETRPSQRSKMRLPPRLTRNRAVSSFYGPRYTWSNGRGPCAIVWRRLDRGMVNDNWLTSFPATTISHLASTGSDHSPLLMEMHVRPEGAKKYFKLLNCWTESASFLPLVQTVWDKQIQGNAMWIFHQKTKALCSELSKWSRREYGDIFQQVKEYKSKVIAAEEVWAHTNNPVDRE